MVTAQRSSTRGDARALTSLVAVAGGVAGLAYLTVAPTRGWLVLAAVLVLDLGLPLVARSRGRDDWFAAWLVLAPLSIFQVLPDWSLVTVAGTLRFPDLGGPRVGDAVPLAMAAMWVPPLLAVVLLAGRSAWRGAVLAVLVLGIAEYFAPTLGLWEPVGTFTERFGVALYVLPAEALLGACTVLVVTHARTAAERLAGAAATALVYTGALFVGLLLLDRGQLVLA